MNVPDHTCRGQQYFFVIIVCRYIYFASFFDITECTSLSSNFTSSLSWYKKSPFHVFQLIHYSQHTEITLTATSALEMEFHPHQSWEAHFVSTSWYVT